MSTKIYNAYKYNGTINDLMQLFRVLQEEFARYADEKADEVITQEWRNWFYKDHLEDSVIILYPLSSTVTLFQVFLTDYMREATSIIINKWVNLGTISDYHYQNQADPWYAYKENLTDEEIDKYKADYKQREEDWNEVFKQSSIPGEVGITMNLLPSRTDFLYPRTNKGVKNV